MVYSSYLTADGTVVEQAGVAMQISDTQTIIAQSGQYAYTSPDGTFIQLTYVADQNGFQPIGAHLPTTPKPPDFVIQMLADLRAAGRL